LTAMMLTRICFGAVLFILNIDTKNTLINTLNLLSIFNKYALKSKA